MQNSGEDHALSSPSHIREPQQLCLCTCLWQVEILCAPVVTQQHSLPPTSRSYKLTQLLGEIKGKKQWCNSLYSICRFMCLHGFLSGFPCCFDLHPPSPVACEPLFLHVCETVIKKGFGGLPTQFRAASLCGFHTLHPDTSHLWLCCGRGFKSAVTLCSPWCAPTILLWRMKVKLWPLDAVVYPEFWPHFTLWNIISTHIYLYIHLTFICSYLQFKWILNDENNLTTRSTQKLPWRSWLYHMIFLGRKSFVMKL